MRLLAIAYEFPPSPSPQSLRWAFLTSELVLRGHEVRVLAPDLVGATGEQVFPSGNAAEIVRTYAGPVMGFLARRTRRRIAAAEPKEYGAGSVPGPTKLNWKGRVFERFRDAASLIVFPDLRAEWNRTAILEAERLCSEWQPDVVVTSHEPASTLEIGLALARRGVHWVADLGDPVCAPYTPRRWRRRAMSLEREVWKTAHGILVTTEATKALLIERHGESRGACTVVPQGFPDKASPNDAAVTMIAEGKELELVYTGSFYKFRDPGPLVEAVLSTAGIRLTIASGAIPQYLQAAAKRRPDALRLLGRLSHQDALALQARADVLVNIGNLDPTQTPGKLFEYLGSGRPILHLASAMPDEAADLLVRAGAGWICENEFRAVSEALVRLLQEKRQRRLGADLARDHAMLIPFRWASLAARVELALTQALATT